MSFESVPNGYIYIYIYITVVCQERAHDTFFFPGVVFATNTFIFRLILKSNLINFEIKTSNLSK